MMDLQSEVSRTVERFVAQLVELARHTAIEMLHTAFARSIAASATDRSGERTGERRPVAAGTSPKRTPADLQALSRRVAAFVEANPGLHIAQISRSLGATTKDLALPIRKLTAGGVIRTVGQKRTTRYFAIPRPALGPGSGASTEADVQRIARAPEPATRITGEPAAGPSRPSERTAGWQRCLADVFTLAQRLEE